MDIQKFQQKLTEVCELGEKNGKVLKPEQIKECFGELDLDKSQLIKILQYLKLKGISIEGAEEISAASQTGPEEVSEEKEEKVPLTAEEEAYQMCIRDRCLPLKVAGGRIHIGNG